MHDTLSETVVEHRGVKYSILEGSSVRGTKLLVSSLGYFYGVKKKQPEICHLAMHHQT